MPFTFQFIFGRFGKNMFYFTESPVGVSMGCVSLYDIDECDPDPCLNGATCTDSNTDNSIELHQYHCDCPTGYNGTNCEYDTDACDPDLCQNGATCASKVEMQSYELYLADID
jgi:hypothetical protein